MGHANHGTIGNGDEPHVPRTVQAMMVEGDGHENRLRQALLRPLSGAMAAGLISAIRVFSRKKRLPHN